MDSRNARYSQTRVNAGRLLRAWRAFKDTPSIEQGVTLHVSGSGVSLVRGGFAPTVASIDQDGYGSTAVYWPATTINNVMMSLYIEADPDETVTVEQREDGPELVMSTEMVNPIRATRYGVNRTGAAPPALLATA